MLLATTLCLLSWAITIEQNKRGNKILNVVVTKWLLVLMLYWKNSTALSMIRPISIPQIFGYLSVRITFATQAQVTMMLFACVKNIVCELMVAVMVSSCLLGCKYI